MDAHRLDDLVLGPQYFNRGPHKGVLEERHLSYRGLCHESRVWKHSLSKFWESVPFLWQSKFSICEPQLLPETRLMKVRATRQQGAPFLETIHPKDTWYNVGALIIKIGCCGLLIVNTV